MGTFLMFGNYTRESMEGIGPERTGKAEAVIKSLGGDVRGMYALLGKEDLLLIVDFPGLKEAVRASVELTRTTGIDFHTVPGLSVSDFDTLMSKPL